MAGNITGEKTKEKILDAAQAVFVEKGYAGARMEDVARRANITKTMLYYHFDTKRNLLHEISQRTVNELKQAFEESAALSGGQSPEPFQAHLANMMVFFAQHRSVIRLIISEYIAHPEEAALSGFKEMFGVIQKLAGRETEDKEFTVKLFFFNALPMLLYACIGDKFCEDFGVSRDMNQRVFVQTFSKVFFANAAEG